MSPHPHHRTLAFAGAISVGIMLGWVLFEWAKPTLRWLLGYVIGHLR